MIGIPFAVVYLIRKAVTLQSIVIEERGGDIRPEAQR